jgi:hypothetical protein
LNGEPVHGMVGDGSANLAAKFLKGGHSLARAAIIAKASSTIPV